jgi:hypothetical protein
MMERGATAILKNIVKDETASLQGREVTNGQKAGLSHPAHSPGIGKITVADVFLTPPYCNCCLQLKAFYNFFPASGSLFLSKNTSTKTTTSVASDSVNSRCLNDAPPPPHAAL